jgi:endonuclease YncB( thermonuclease family)
MRTLRLPRNFLWSAPIVASLIASQTRGNEPQERMPVIYTSAGDTVVVENARRERPWIRLNGVGTPESSDSGVPDQFKGMPVPEVLEACTRGITVSVVPDPQVTENLGERAKAYAHRSPDGLDLGLALIQYGWAYARRDYPYTRQAAYVAAEQKARSAGRGYWASKVTAQSSQVPDTGVTTAVATKSFPPLASKPSSGPQFSSPKLASSASGQGKQYTPPKRRTRRYAHTDPSTTDGGSFGRPGGTGFLGLPMFGVPSIVGPGSVYVNGYNRSNGTYVQPYTRRPPGG